MGVLWSLIARHWRGFCLEVLDWKITIVPTLTRCKDAKLNYRSAVKGQSDAFSAIWINSFYWLVPVTKGSVRGTSVTLLTEHVNRVGLAVDLDCESRGWTDQGWGCSGLLIYLLVWSHHWPIEIFVYPTIYLLALSNSELIIAMSERAICSYPIFISWLKAELFLSESILRLFLAQLHVFWGYK